MIKQMLLYLMNYRSLIILLILILIFSNFFLMYEVIELNKNLSLLEDNFTRDLDTLDSNLKTVSNNVAFDQDISNSYFKYIAGGITIIAVASLAFILMNDNTHCFTLLGDSITTQLSNNATLAKNLHIDLLDTQKVAEVQLDASITKIMDKLVNISSYILKSKTVTGNDLGLDRFGTTFE